VVETISPVLGFYFTFTLQQPKLFPTPSSSVMPNHRVDCLYCKKSVLYRDFGNHIIKNHSNDLFGDKENRKNLYRDKYLKDPLQLSLDTDTYYFCLADNSCIRNTITAQNHFKGKKDKHIEAVMALREKYPAEEGTESIETKREPLLSAKELKSIQEEIVLLFQHQVDNKIDVYEFSKKSKASLKKLGISVDFEDIKAEYPHCFPEPEVEEEQEEQPEEQYEEPPPPPEETEESDEHLIPPPPPPYVPPPVPSSHYAIPKPRQETFLVKERTPAPAFPSVKIIQSTKRPSPSGAL